MQEFKDVPLKGSLGIVARVFRSLPLPISLAAGRFFGYVGYYLMSKKRALVYANLKTAFSQNKSPAQIRKLSREVFINLTQSFVELLCIGNMKRKGFNHFVKVQGQEYVDQAIKQGKGVIFLAIHSGNWELGNVFNSLTGHTYNIVTNEQPKMPQLTVLLNEARIMAGAQVISSGEATKEIIKALKRNEIVGLTLDQGGAEGVMVDFFGKTVSMSSGAMRLALKYGSAVCPAWITRQADGSHVLQFSPALTLIRSGDVEQDIQSNVQLGVKHYEELLKKHPQEYLWFYKVFKYTSQAQVLILDDGHPGHLQQSQTLESRLKDELIEQGKTVKENTIQLCFQSLLKEKVFSLYVSWSRFLGFLRNEGCLKFFLTDTCYSSLMSLKADVVISCGKQSSGVNFIISQNHQAKSMIVASG